LSPVADQGNVTGCELKNFSQAGRPANGPFAANPAAVSIAWDTEFGFRREMLVAPVSRAALVIGKFLGGAPIATGHGLVFPGPCRLPEVPCRPLLHALMALTSSARQSLTQRDRRKR
jgi:ABC-2 type transport system permease protein